MTFITVNLVLFLITALLLVILSWVWPPDSPWSPWWRTDKRAAREICKLAGITRSDLVYELGSGNAAFLITAAKEFGARGIGIEIDPLRFIISTLMVHVIGVHDKVIIKRKNFFDEDISDATVVYVYLVPKTLEKLLPKFKKELKKGTKIVSYKYPLGIKNHELRIKNNLSLYKV